MGTFDTMLAEMANDLKAVDNALDFWKAENKSLQAENKRLREALQWYVDQGLDSATAEHAMRKESDEDK